MCSFNGVAPNEEAFFLFVEQINTVAVDIKKQPKLEQLVTMYLLLNFQHHRTLI